MSRDFHEENDIFYEEDDAAEFEQPRSRRRLGVILLTSAMAVVLVGCGVMATLLKGVGHERAPTASAPKGSPSTPIASTFAPPTTEAPAALAETSSAPPSQAPSPSKKPKATEVAQAPAPNHSTPPGCAPSKGPNQLPKTTVKGYLDKAAATHFWGTKTKVEYADILVPKRLLYAIAEQESGWQSDIKACDGGLGLMQIMPNTQGSVNFRFGTTWDRTKPSDNVMLGANYLAWLIAYYGDRIATQHGTTPSYDALNPELLKPVISAYNWGTGGVEPGMGTFPNGTYVQNVLYLMDHSRAGNY
ncbi:transglycosylase SLT domain-containing protein [Dactylosporangium sp. NPDC051484]|uniref:lytic transglycosylase domain-containing protein n=1 Tax=Dactylosporangium sp. NPDC051484 TaxID=3154942 RepID=UPI00344B3F98